MRLWLPIIAALGLAIAIVMVMMENHHQAKAPASPAADAARAPFRDYVAGAGVLEASTQNIAVGTPVPGIVSDVYVRWGDRVKTGDRLFKIDDRGLQADLVSAAAKVHQSESVLANADGETVYELEVWCEDKKGRKLTVGDAVVHKRA